MDEKDIRKKAKKEAKEFSSGFKNFISKGNIIDLAVAVIMGTAFNKIVSSFVNDIIMPLFVAIFGKSDISNLSVQIGEATLKYGVFIQAIIEFLIIAFSIYIAVEYVLGRKRKREKLEKEKKPVEVKPSNEEALLMEIRDLLKERKENKNEK